MRIQRRFSNLKFGNYKQPSITAYISNFLHIFVLYDYSKKYPAHEKNPTASDQFLSDPEHIWAGAIATYSRMVQVGFWATS